MFFLTSVVLGLVLAGTNVASGGAVWESRVSSGSDDSEEAVSSGGIDLNSSDLEIPYENAGKGNPQVIGLRFVDIPIPKGAIVDKAFVELTCDETKDGALPVSLLIEGELNPNPVKFSEATNDITKRPRTTAKAVWVPANWTQEGQKDQTSDITAIVQEIINLAGWASGNALVLIFRDDPGKPSQGLRCAEASNDPANAPLLHVEYRGKYAMQPNPPDGSLYEDRSAVLSWLPGLNAVSHDVYFGDSFDDVRDGTGDAFQGNQVETFFTVGVPGTPIPGGLVPGTTYYWRVDEVEADGTKNKGPVWSFTIPSKKAYNSYPPDGAKFMDPDTNLSWTAGSGAKIHTVFFGDSFDDVNSAVAGSSQAGTTYDPGPLQLDKTYYWRVDEFDGVGTHKGDTLGFTTLASRGIGLRGDYYTGMSFEKLVLTRIDPQINFPWGGSAPDDAVGATNFSVRWTGDVSAQFTQTYTFYTITDDGIHLWVNGVPIIDNWTQHGDTEDRGRINLVAGQFCNIVMEYFQAGSGSIAQLGWESPSTKKQIIPTYLLWPPVRARNPKPPYGATNVKHTQILRWTAGDEAASHEVYFGTDADAVRNAIKSSPEYEGTKALGDEKYDPGKLDWYRTYYWRVDEVNNVHPDSPWVGSLWSFTTGDFLVVDDFEDYDAGDNQIWYSWHDGLGYGTPGTPDFFGGNSTGSAVGDDKTPSYTEETIVHDGRHSMPVAYDNNKQGFAKYSEVELKLTTARDWTEEGVAELSLWFRGDSTNDAEPLYVAVSNSAGQPAVVVHPDPAAAQITTWTEWVVPLQSLAAQGITLTNVDRIAVGLGTRGNMTTPGGSGKMYIDDIRLYRPRTP